MQSLATRFLVAAFAVGFLAATDANAWQNRPNVIRAAQVLEEEVEHFDTSLHNIHAPNDLIAVVHHFEETVMEFLEEVRNGCSYQFAQSEMNHIRQDVGLIRQKLSIYPSVLHNPAVSREWQHMRTAYRNLDHQMFFWVNGRWSDAEVAQLRADMAELEAAHE